MQVGSRDLNNDEIATLLVTLLDSVMATSPSVHILCLCLDFFQITMEFGLDEDNAVKEFLHDGVFVGFI